MHDRTSCMLRDCIALQEPPKSPNPLGWPTAPPSALPPLLLTSNLELPDTPKQAMHCHTPKPLPMLCPFRVTCMLSPLSLPHKRAKSHSLFRDSSNVAFSGKPFPVFPVKKIITLPVGSISSALCQECCGAESVTSLPSLRALIYEMEANPLFPRGTVLEDFSKRGHMKPLTIVWACSPCPVNPSWPFNSSPPTRQGAGRVGRASFPSIYFGPFQWVLRFPPRDADIPPLIGNQQ